jgi:hypothetical protein
VPARLCRCSSGRLLRYRDETMPRYDVAHFGFAPLGAHRM